MTALAAEQAALTRSIAPQSQLLLVQCGMGPAKARQGLQTVLKQGAGRVVFMGFGAGLRDDASTGRVLIPHEILSGQDSLAVDADWQRRICQTLADMNPATDPLLCVDAPLLDIDAKAEWAERAIGCDMESAAILTMAHHEGIPAAIIRVVLDGPKDVVPPLALTLVDDDGDLCWPDAGSCLHPLQWWQLAQLIPRFRLAHRRLQEAARRIIASHGSDPV